MKIEEALPRCAVITLECRQPGWSPTTKARLKGLISSWSSAPGSKAGIKFQLGDDRFDIDITDVSIQRRIPAAALSQWLKDLQVHIAQATWWGEISVWFALAGEERGVTETFYRFGNGGDDAVVEVVDFIKRVGILTES